MSDKDPRDMTPEEYLDWLDETGQDVDQFDEADEKTARQLDEEREVEDSSTGTKGDPE